MKVDCKPNFRSQAGNRLFEAWLAEPQCQFEHDARQPYPLMPAVTTKLNMVLGKRRAFSEPPSPIA